MSQDDDYQEDFEENKKVDNRNNESKYKPLVVAEENDDD